jgi:hypothetical protein
MKTTVTIGVMLLFGAQPAGAVRLMTPNTDSCLAFTTAMQRANSNQEPAPFLLMSAWVTGFMSGIAEGSNVDILRGLDITQIIARVYQKCAASPELLLTVAAERTAAEILNAHGVTVK